MVMADELNVRYLLLCMRRVGPALRCRGGRGVSGEVWHGLDEVEDVPGGMMVRDGNQASFLN